MLIVMVGLPGSGKSTYAESNFRHIVSPDRIRMDEFGVEFDPEIEPEVWDLAFARVRERLARRDVVCFDATSVSRRRRAALLDLAAVAGAPAVAVWVRTAPEEAWRRNQERGRTVPLEAFENLVAAFQPPTPEEGFAAVVEVGAGAG